MGDANEPKPPRAATRPAGRADPNPIPRMWEDEPEPSRTSPTGIARRTAVAPTKRTALLVMTGTDAGRVLLIGSRKVTVGRSKQADFTLRDEGVSRMHCGLAREGATCVLTDLGSTHGTFVNGVRTDRVELCAGDRIQLGPDALLEFDVYDEDDEGVAKKLYEGATRDLLTHALNRRAFCDRLAAEVAYAVRHRTKLVAVAVEIDQLNAVIDLHGNAAGDAVLCDVAAAISSTLRSEDALARLRSHGFVVLSRGLSLRNGVKLAERMRKLVEDRVVPFGGQRLRVTLSAGVAELAETCELGETGELRAIRESGDPDETHPPRAGHDVRSPCEREGLRELLLGRADARLASARCRGPNHVVSKDSK